MFSNGVHVFTKLCILFLYSSEVCLHSIETPDSILSFCIFFIETTTLGDLLRSEQKGNSIFLVILSKKENTLNNVHSSNSMRMMLVFSALRVIHC